MTSPAVKGMRNAATRRGSNHKFAPSWTGAWRPIRLPSLPWRHRGSAAPRPRHPFDFGDVAPVRGIPPRHLQDFQPRCKGADSLSRVILLIFFAHDDSAGKGEPSMPQREASQDDGPCPSQMPRSAGAATPDDASRALRWKTVAENGEMVADSAEGHRHQGYAITMAKKPNPRAALVIDDDFED